MSGNITFFNPLILRRSLSDEPDAPGWPIVTDWDSDFVELEWTRPRHDGGAPITGYIIQKKAKGSPIWQNAARVPADTTKVRGNLTSA